MRSFLSLFILFILFLANPAYASILNIQEVTSPGGIKAWLVEDNSVPVISLQFAFEGAGAIHDPANAQGLARIVSSTLDEGAGDLDSQSFQKTLQDHSISLSYGAGRDHFSGSLKTLTRYKSHAFELLRLSLTRPRFDEDAVERMKSSNLSRIKSSLSDSKWMAARIMNDRVFENHVYAQNSGGTLSGLETITPKDLRAFHRSYLGKNNLVVAVSGDIGKYELSRVLDEVFGELPDVSLPAPPPSTDVQNQGKTYLYKQNIPQTIIRIMQNGIDRKDPDFQTAQVMNFVLGSSGFGSRLMSEIREKRGLTYGIYSYFQDMKYFEGLGVSTSTENKNVAEMLGLIKAEWNKIKDTPVSEKELQDAKNYLIGSLPLSLTSTDRISGLILSLQLDDLPIDYLDKRETEIKKTTIQDVHSLAQKLLDTGQMLTVLVGQPEDIENIKNVEEITELPNVE